MCWGGGGGREGNGRKTEVNKRQLYVSFNHMKYS